MVAAKLLDWVYPAKCGLCDRLSPVAICAECRSEFEAIPRAGRPVVPPVDYAFAVFSYRGRAGQAVRRLKMSRVTSLAKPMSELMREAALELKLEADWTVPVPIHWSRRSWRGFNQAELLAESFPNVHPVLLKIRKTKPQVMLDSLNRGTNLIGAFSALPSVVGKSILLIDDVLTTGSTARYCATALKAAGAREVGLLAFAEAIGDDDRYAEPPEMRL
jgi:competence protein ComFC